MLSFHCCSRWYRQQSRGFTAESVTLAPGCWAERHWEPKCMLGACSVGFGNSEGKEWKRSQCSASFRKLCPSQFSQAIKSAMVSWSLAHSCGLAELGHWGSSVVAAGITEGGFPSCARAGAPVAQPGLPQSAHLEAKPYFCAAGL